MKQLWFTLLVLLILLTACNSSAARYNNQGNQGFAAKKYDAAMEDYRLAQQADPDLAAPYYNAGNTRYRQHDTEGAESQLQQSLRAADGELSEKTFYNLGNTYFGAQDWTKAIEAYKRALLLNPNDLDAKHNLELALQQQQQQNQQGQQNQQQQGGGGSQQQDQQNQQGQPNDQNQPNGGGSQGEQQDQSGGGDQSQDAQSPGQGRLSRRQAEQLLDALGQEGQTLQQRLQQQIGGGPMPLPDKDW